MPILDGQVGGVWRIGMTSWPMTPNRREMNEQIASEYRYSSGCMDCNVWKCTAYWMRREGKRLGRKIPYELNIGCTDCHGEG